MSCRPKLLARNCPTGAVKGYLSSHDFAHLNREFIDFSELSAIFAIRSRSFSSFPPDQRVAVPARQAYSHSASVGRRYVGPSFWLNHLQNSTASYQHTFTTGCASVC